MFFMLKIKENYSIERVPFFFLGKVPSIIKSGMGLKKTR
jgi:hypothetical protein